MSNAVILIHTDGIKTLSQYARQYSIKVNDIITANNPYNRQQAGYYYTDGAIPAEYMTIADYLEHIRDTGDPVVAGNFLLIPASQNNSVRKYIYNLYGIDHEYDSSGSGVTPRRILRTGFNRIKYNGVFTVLANGIERIRVYPLPISQEFSDDNTASFSPVDILGRSVAYQVYNYSGRSCSLSLDLHSDLLSDPSQLKDIVAGMTAVAYPDYDSDGVVAPPEVIIEMLNLRVRGIVSSISTKWETPVIDNEYARCNVSLSITETTGPYSMPEISLLGGYRNI